MSDVRYQILGKLGQGGAGEVFLAKDTQLDRDVAIKRVKVPEGASAEQMAQDLIREAKTLSTLQHPNIVTVYDVAKDEKGPFVVLEYLKGETLGAVIQRAALPLHDFTEVVTQSLEGLIAAHSMGLVHRDLKSDNLMVVWLPSGKFQIKILDFGLSKFSQKARPQTEDQGGGIMGSIFFMAPEQFERLPLDARTDMYSLGCIFYEILTTQYPFQGETGTEVMVSHLQHHVKPIQQLRPDLPEWLGHWVMWLISREMDDRPTDARTALEYFRQQSHACPGVHHSAPQQQNTAQPTARPQSAAQMQRGMSPATRVNAPQGSVPGRPNQPQPVTGMPPGMGRPQYPPAYPPAGPKSKAGLVLTLTLVGVALAIGSIFFFSNRNKPAKPAPGSVGDLLARTETTGSNGNTNQNTTSPTTPPKETSPPAPKPPTPPSPKEALTQASIKMKQPSAKVQVNAKSAEDALNAMLFLPVKSSERAKNFVAVSKQLKLAYSPEKHGPILRGIVHESAAAFAASLGDTATADFINKAEKEKFVLQANAAAKVKPFKLTWYPLNAEPRLNADKSAVEGWEDANTCLALDLSLPKASWEVWLSVSCPDPSNRKIEVMLGRDSTEPFSLPETKPGEFKEIPAGIHTVAVGGTHRLWIRAAAAPGGEILKLGGIRIQKK